MTYDANVGVRFKGKLNFVPSKVDPRTVKFADPAKESERQKLLMKLEAEAKNKGTKQTPKKRKLKKKKISEEDEDLERPKKIRNALKRDLEELEVDYKMYRLEKKGKVFHQPEVLVQNEDVDLSMSDEESKIEERSRSSQKPIPERFSHPQRSFQRNALSLALQKKLETMQQKRRKSRTKM